MSTPSGEWCAPTDRPSKRLSQYPLYPKWVPAKSCRSPFRPDRTASFSVFDEGRRWYDFAEGTGGDVVDFVRRALACSFQEAIKYLGGCGSDCQQLSKPDCIHKPSRPTQHWPSLRKPTQIDLQRIAKIRGISVKGLELAVSHGLLWTASYYGFPSWVVTDSERRTASFRRLDGKR